MSSDPDPASAGPAAEERARIAKAVRRMENLLAPREFIAEKQWIEMGGDTGLAAALNASVTTRDLERQHHLKSFRSTRLSHGIVLFKGHGESARRNLLVVFGGKDLRPMLPMPLFLQRLTTVDWDVLLLVDRQKQHFRFGAGDKGASFPDLAGWIVGLSAGYRRVVALGTSMGALAAVRLALFAPGTRAIAIGARPASDHARIFQPGPLPPAFDPVCACLPQTPRDVMFVHAKGHAVDGHWAHGFSRLSGGVVMEVSGCKEHNVLAHLWRAGRLQAFLAAALSEGPVADVWQRADAAANPTAAV